jgi:hypothetical protein
MVIVNKSYTNLHSKLVHAEDPRVPKVHVSRRSNRSQELRESRSISVCYICLVSYRPEVLDAIVEDLETFALSDIAER